MRCNNFVISKILICFLLHIIFFIDINLISKAKEVKQNKIGNLSLATSQQPGPTFSFGQNIIDKGDSQGYLVFNNYFGINNQRLSEIDLQYLYGINESSSLFVDIPVNVKFKNNQKRLSSTGDITVQYEYAFYNKDTEEATKQLTFVGNIGIPTSSGSKELEQFGSVSFFLGFTASYYAVDWYLFTSNGATFSTKSSNKTKFGNIFCYQFGLGHNINYSDNWILMALVELDGFFFQKNKINKVIDTNSGGNIIYLGPSLGFSTKKYFIQGGFQLPIHKNIFSQKMNETIRTIFWLGMTF